MAAALVSAFTERAVYKHVGMTGEITLRGKVLPVGGIREKVLAAHRAGLKTVLIPERNLKDLVDIPKRVRTDLNLVSVTHMDQVLQVALHPQETRPPRHRKSQAEKEKTGEKTVELAKAAET